MDTIEVRQGRPADAGTITDFQVKMALESEGLELDRATVAEGVRAVFEDPSKGRYWVACEGERILGVMLTSRPRPRRPRRTAARRVQEALSEPEGQGGRVPRPRGAQAIRGQGESGSTDGLRGPGNDAGALLPLRMARMIPALRVRNGDRIWLTWL